MSHFIDWSQKLSIGVHEIDEQHMKLVELVNEMHEAIQQHRASEVTLKILDDLIVYTKTHFQTEEALMDILEYEDFSDHKATHDQLIQQIGELKEKLDAGEASVNFELMHFLKQWLTHHILGDDAKMGAYFVNVKKAPRQQRSLYGRMRAALRLR